MRSTNIERPRRAARLPWIGALLALAGCGIFTVTTAGGTAPAPGGSSSPTDPSGASSPAATMAFGIEDARAYAEKSAVQDLDCPMPQADAEKMRELGRSGGDAGELAGRIGCSCAVRYACDGPTRLSSDQCYLYGSLQEYRARRERDPSGLGVDEALVAWGERLYEKREASVHEVTRVDELAAEKPAVSEDEQMDTELYGAMLSALRSMQEASRTKTWFLVPRYHENLVTNLGLLEQNVLCGQQSRPAREVFTQAEALMAVAEPKARAWAKMEQAVKRDAEYRSLQKQADGYSKTATRMAHNAHIRDGDYDRYCSNASDDRSDMCRTHHKEQGVRAKMDAIRERYLRKFGYYDE